MFTVQYSSLVCIQLSSGTIDCLKCGGGGVRAEAGFASWSQGRIAHYGTGWQEPSWLGLHHQFHVVADPRCLGSWFVTRPLVEHNFVVFFDAAEERRRSGWR